MPETMQRLEFKAAFTADEAGAISGVAWPFGGPDRMGDVITPAAFAGAVGKTRPMLSGHPDPVGVWDSIGTDAECDRLVVVLKEILRWNGD